MRLAARKPNTGRRSYDHKVARRDEQRADDRKDHREHHLVQHIHPQRVPAPKRERRVPIVLPKPRQERAPLGIEHRRDRRAYQHVAGRREHRIVVRRPHRVGGIGSGALHPLREPKEGVVVGKRISVPLVDLRKAVVDEDDRQPQHQTDERRLVLVAAAADVHDHPQQNGEREHVQYAERDRRLYQRRDDGDDPREQRYFDAPLEVVFGRFYDRVQLEDAKYITSSLALLNRTGGNIVKVFASIEKSFYNKKKLRNELNSMTASSLFVFRVLIFLPFVFALVIYLLNPSYFAPLFTTSLGMAILCLIIIIFALYILIIKKVLRIDI